MVFLTDAQIRQILKQPISGTGLAAARRLEKRLQLHTQVVVDQDELHLKAAHFLDWVSKILPPDKMEGFRTLFTGPVDTIEFTENIFGELSKVFDAENVYIKHLFKDAQEEADFEEFLKEENDENFWKTKYWRTVQSNVNSYMVVDLPLIQEGGKPEPYYFILHNESVIDLLVDCEGELEYLMYWSKVPGQVIVVDEMNWFIYQLSIDQENKFVLDFDKAVLTATIPHNLDKVPACPLYFDPIDDTDFITNNNPITKSLSKLDWLEFFEVARKYLETYAPFPIYATYSELDDLENQTKVNGEELLHGMEQTLLPGEKIIGRTDHANKNQTNKRLVGPGTIQKYDAPKDNQDSDLLRNPVQVIPAETESLNYCKEKIDAYEAKIFANCVGKGGDVLNNQAANELQVQSTFESRINVLSKIRMRIEKCRKYVYECMGELRYGDLYSGSDVSLGDAYYLESVEQQTKTFTESKDAGLPQYELENQVTSIFKNKYKDQPQMMARNILLGQLEPYPGESIKDIADLVKGGLADKEKFQIKLEFDTLIKRFEREQMNIVDFASARPLATKIQIIKQKLQDYVREENSASELQSGLPAPGAGKPGDQPLPTAAGTGAVEQGQQSQQAAA
jgi:hypothetical protein